MHLYWMNQRAAGSLIMWSLILTLLPTAAPVAAAETLTKISLASVDPLAVCTDGSPAAYYFKPGTSPVWIVDLQGGGWCWDPESCSQRCPEGTESVLCSSKAWNESITVDGVLAAGASSSLGEMLDKANKVFVTYCTSDAHMGDAAAFGKQFRGARVLRAVLADLLSRHGLGLGTQAREVLVFGGQSAGARGAMVHLDFIPGLLGAAASKVDVVGFLDSPLWIDVSPFPTHNFTGFNNTCRDVYGYANVTHIPEECRAAYPGEEWKCIMGEYRMGFLNLPYMVVAAQYDEFQLMSNVGHKPTTQSELAYADYLARETHRLVEWLRAKRIRVGQYPTAFYTQACYSHATSLQAYGFRQVTAGDGRDKATMKLGFEAFLSSYLSGSGGDTAFWWTDSCLRFDCGPGCHPKMKKQKEKMKKKTEEDVVVV